MASIQRPASSGSGSGSGSDVAIDERKRKRMLSNRESARRSRMRKQKQLEDLTDEVTRVQLSNRDLVQKINAKEQNYGAIESANNVLRAQHAELADRLRSLNSVLQMIEEMNGFSMDIPEIPDSMMNPWQLDRPFQPIMADMFLPWSIILSIGLWSFIVSRSRFCDDESFVMVFNNLGLCYVEKAVKIVMEGRLDFLLGLYFVDVVVCFIILMNVFLCFMYSSYYGLLGCGCVSDFNL